MESQHGRIRLSGKSDTDRKKRNELENQSKLVKNTVNNNGKIRVYTLQLLAFINKKSKVFLIKLNSGI